MRPERRTQTPGLYLDSMHLPFWPWHRLQGNQLLVVNHVICSRSGMGPKRASSPCSKNAREETSASTPSPPTLILHRWLQLGANKRRESSAGNRIVQCHRGWRVPVDCYQQNTVALSSVIFSGGTWVPVQCAACGGYGSHPSLSAEAQTIEGHSTFAHRMSLPLSVATE